MVLPIFLDSNKNMMLMQTQWANSLNPVIDLPLNSALIINDISLSTGSNVINHRLGRKLQGWMVTRMKNSFVQIYDQQSTNTMTDKTLVLNSSGAGLIDLLVF